MATLQLYAPWAGALVFSTGSYEVDELPQPLVELLADEKVVKLGCNVWGDGIRLVRDFKNVLSVARYYACAALTHLTLV